MINANEYGFSTVNSAEENTKCLQKAVNKGGDIYISIPGIYNICGPILIGDDTSIYFGAGVYLSREKCIGETGYLFVNRGAYSRTTNNNIKIDGLKIICNEVVSTPASKDSKKVIAGLRGHISFFCVKNLIIKNIQIPDLPTKDFGIHVCNFENVIIENVKIDGLKDAVHLGCGEKFVIRHGIFKTFDDPIALNAHDYASSNPMLGWITDGLIKDCYDLNDESTTGFFCRILAGSWKDWESGMEIQNSDSVVYNGTVYRALMAPDGAVYKTVTPPTHKRGIEIVDGINWVAVQDNETHSCGCKNIHFKDIYIKKKRPVAFSIHFDKDAYSRSYYPNSKAPVQENIIFENIVIENEVPTFLYSITPVKNIKILNSNLKDSKIKLANIDTDGIDYNETDIFLSGTSVENIDNFIEADKGISAILDIAATNRKQFKN